MWSSTIRSVAFKIPKTFRRSYSFLDSFCKKDDNKGGSDSDPSVTVELENAFKLYNLEEEPQSKICLTRSLALQLYTEMQTMRRMENTLANLYKDKSVRGFCHLYVGQEACCTGIKSIMQPQDTVITSYRSHGWTWIMGVTVHEIIAELCQKHTGCSRGKGGSMHTYARKFFGGNGIVGAQTSLGTGLALMHAYTCSGGVNFTLYGDGAANQGQLHESFNLACLFKLPAIFVCENNKYSMGTSTKRSACSTDYYTRGDYIPGIWANGNNVLAVRSAAQYAADHARKCGPIVLELETYRYFGHSMSDPGTSYRTREEVQMMREKFDPIIFFKNLCFNSKLFTEEEVKKIDATIKQEVDDAVAQVRKDKEPDLEELTTDVYARNLGGNIRGTTGYNFKHNSRGTRFVPPGKVKATPKSLIKELPKPEPPKKDGKPGDEKGKAEAKAKDGKPATKPAEKPAAKPTAKPDSKDTKPKNK